MKSEKTLFILIFTTFFLLSGTLMYLMIAKDLKQKDSEVRKMSEPVVDNTLPVNWPKVEINARK